MNLRKIQVGNFSKYLYLCKGLKNFINCMRTSLNFKIDTFLFPLNSYYSDSVNTDKQLAKIVENVSCIVKNYFAGNIDIETFVNAHLENVFSFKISAIKWIIENDIKSINVEEISDWLDVGLEKDTALSVLYQNTLFAIRTNVRAINSMMNRDNAQTSEKKTDLSVLKNFSSYTYSSILNEVSMTMPDIFFSAFTDYLNYSLHLEFGIIAAFVVYKENIKLSEPKINELSAFIADSAQEFGAIAKKTQPVKNNFKSFSDTKISDEFLVEETHLTEQGIQDFLLSID